MKRVLGIDPGEARIGVAVSDELGMLAHPCETIDCKKNNAVQRLGELAREKDVEKIVVGCPRNMDGSHGPGAEKAKQFADALANATGLTVILWDERLTTVAASRSLHAAGRNAKQQKRLIDQVAAQHILQSWLDASAGSL
jgi:putative Holliday junction resolvase